MRHLHGAVAKLQHKIALAEARATSKKGGAPSRYPMAPDELALAIYRFRLTQDDTLRQTRPDLVSISIDDLRVERLRMGVAGRASDDELRELVGDVMAYCRSVGNLDAAPGTPAWREIARALCIGELEALARAAELPQSVTKATSPANLST